MAGSLSAPVPTDPAASRRRRPEQTRLELLEAAAHAIAEHGYHGMSLRRLAAACGRSLGNFYNHFPSKEALLHALHRDAFEQLLATATAATAAVDEPASRLYAFILQHVRYVSDHPDVMRVLVYEAAALPSDARAEVRELKERYFAIGHDLVGALIQRGCVPAGVPGRPEESAAEIERATYAVFGMLNWVYAWYEADRHGDPATVARTLHSLAMCGLVSRCHYGALQDDADVRLAAFDAPPLFGEATDPAPPTTPHDAGAP